MTMTTVVFALVCVLGTLSLSHAQENFQEFTIDADGEFATCEDQDKDCSYWAKIGECDANPMFMLYNCQVSCNACGKSNDELEMMINEAKDRDAKKSEDKQRMFENFGVDQQLEDVRDPKGTKQWLQETRFYIENIVRVEDRYAEVSSECLNRDAMCTAWAVDGYCEPDNENYAYMELQCAPACRTCHNLIFEERCPWDSSNATNAWKPGSLDSMFQRITQEPYYVHEYSPSILSRPGGDPHDDSVKDGPWIVVLDNFVKEDECDRLIDLGAQEGYQLSKDIGDRQFDGTYGDQESEYRTSTNAWCTESCYEDPATQQVVRRMENLTDIPDNYAEHFQLLRYQVGQFYGQHHDYSSHIKDRAEGVRILTVFFYLNDVEQGGGTRFPLLDITVTPKKGRALVWPSVLNDAPHDMDERTEHEALPVQEGIKYGANAWVHMRDFKTPYADGCAT